MRESALGATVFVPGEPEGWEGWEDAAVPPAQLGNYLREIAALMSEYGYRSPLYGHYGQGCVHMRINFDFRTEKGLRDFREFIDRAADLVLSFGGSLSGEHGDGQARAALLPKMFGPELMQAFREFKALWDPDNRMNPGKLVDAVRVYDPAREPPPLHRLAGCAMRLRASKPISSSAKTAARSNAPPSAASAWAPAARRAAASCVPAIAPPATSSTPPAAALVCCGRCWPAICAAKASRAKPSTRRSISA